jgi:hypothetical protein
MRFRVSFTFSRQSGSPACLLSSSVSMSRYLPEAFAAVFSLPSLFGASWWCQSCSNPHCLFGFIGWLSLAAFWTGSRLCCLPLSSPDGGFARIHLRKTLSKRTARCLLDRNDNYDTRDSQHGALDRVDFTSIRDPAPALSGKTIPAASPPICRCRQWRLSNGVQKLKEAGAGIEPANRGFADPDLTTWLPRRCEP